MHAALKISILLFLHYTSIFFWREVVKYCSKVYFDVCGSLGCISGLCEVIHYLLTDVRVRIRELEMFVFRKILRTYLMDGPLWGLWIIFLSQIFLMHGIGLFQLHTPWMHQKCSGFLMLPVVRFSDVFRGYRKRAVI